MASRIALTYFLLGILWIVVSDLLLGNWGEADLNQQDEIRANIGKGMLYVSVTAILLFWYVRRQFAIREQKETQFRHLFEEHPNPMIVCNDSGLIEAANPAAALLYGYEKGQLLGLNYAEISGGQEIKEVKNEGHQHKHASGKKISVRVNIKPTRFYNHFSWLILLIDIEEEQRVRDQNLSLHKEIKLQENYLYSLIEAQSTYLIRINLQGKFIFRNKAFLSLFGNSAGLQQPQNLPELLSAQDNKKLTSLLAKCVQLPGKNYAILLQMSLLEGFNRITDWEFLAITDENGNVTEFQGVGRDVTDKLQYLEQLSAYKEQLEGILRTLNDVVWSVDAENFQIRYLNAAAKQFYGRAPEEFYANAALWMQAIVPEDREAVLKHSEMVKETGSGEIEYRIKRLDGTIRHIRDRSVLVKDEKGKPRTINGIATDITDLVTSQRDVRRMNEQISTLLETMTDAFFTLDDQLCFKEVNKSMEKLIGKNRDELKGESFEKYFGEVGMLIYGPLFDASFATKNVQKKQFFDQHHERWFSLAVYPIPSGLAVFINDQTDNFRLQQALIKEQRNLEGLINNTADHIWSVDQNLCLITGNNAFKARFKSIFKVEAKIGEPVLREDQPKNYFNDWKELYERALQGEAFTSVQTRELNGKTYYSEISFNPIIDEKGVISSIGCFGKDITDRTEKELKIKEQNALLLEIAWIESHKLRAPLANMLGLIELLNLQSPSDDQDHLREKLEVSCQELDKIIHEIVHKANAVSYFSKS